MTLCGFCGFWNKLKDTEYGTNNGDKGGEGGEKGSRKDRTPNHNPEKRLSAPPNSPSAATVDPKKSQQGNNASPEKSNSKKRRLACMAKLLMAAGLEVKFTDWE